MIRLWAASADYREDIRVSDEILKRTSDSYRKLRNTLKFLLGNLADFEPAEHAVSIDGLSWLDAAVLGELDHWSRRSITTSVALRSTALCKPSMNTFPGSRRATSISPRIVSTATHKTGLRRRGTQTVIYHHAHTLIRLIAPMMPFTAEDAYDHLLAAPGLVHLDDFPVSSGTAGGESEAPSCCGACESGLRLRWNSFAERSIIPMRRG